MVQMARRHHRRSKEDKDKSKAASIPDRVKSLESKIKLMNQKLKNIEKNNKVVGKTVISQKKNLEDLEDQVSKGGGGVSEADVDQIKEEIKESVSEGGEVSPKEMKRINEKLEDLEKKVSDLQSSVSEAQYILDTVNPMEYVTMDQVKDIVDRRIKKNLEGTE